MDSNNSLSVKTKLDLDQVRFIEIGGGGAGNGGPQDQLSLLGFWRVVRKRKWVIVSCLVLTVTAVTIVSLLMPRKYDAVARINLDFENANSLGLDQLGISAGSDATTKMETQIRIIGSETLAWNVVRQLRLDQKEQFTGQKLLSPANADFEKIDDLRRANLLKAFHNALNVQLVPKTQIIEVRFRNRDPRLAANIVNAISNAYIERSFKTKYEATMKASDWLAKQLDDLKDKTESLQASLTDYQKKAGILGTDENHNVIMSKLDELNRQQSLAQADRIVKEARYRTALTADPELIANLVPESTLAILHRQDAEITAQYTQLAAKFGPAYPKVQQTQKQLDQIHASIDHEVENISKRMETEYQAALKSEQMLTAAFDKQKQEAYRMNNDAVKYAIMLRDVQSSRDLYEGLLKKLKEAGITAGLKSSYVNIVDPASTPVDPAEPRVPLNIALGLLGGLLGGIAMAFVVENVDNSIRTPDDVEVQCALPSLGIIPTIEPAGKNGHKQLPPGALVPFVLPVALSQPKSPISEAYRALRTSLLLASAGAPPKVLVVTSASPGEGKTTTSVNTAIVMAQSGRKVLLVDADMRRPTSHMRFGVPNGNGLSACLAGTAVTEAATITVDVLPNLHVLPAGQIPPNPSELIGSDAMRRLLESWRADYDHIIIDSPPVLAVTDAVILATMADSVIVVARSGVTGSQSLCRARDILRKVHARIAGVVVNDLGLNSAGYADYYGNYGSHYAAYAGKN
ncbi:MAG: polysaccharide biosynthesis tyrosine autokinase [Candidatus Angelobacter sp.]